VALDRKCNPAASITINQPRRLVILHFALSTDWQNGRTTSIRDSSARKSRRRWSWKSSRRKARKESGHTVLWR